MKEQKQLTDIWKEYQKGKDYLSTRGAYTQTKRNYKFYIGDQWDEEAKKLSMPMPVMNIIKPICDYKIGVVAQNNVVINYSSENYDERDMKEESGISFKMIADKTMGLLNKYASRQWENNNMEAEMWNFVAEACVCGTANAYFYNQEGQEIMEMVDANNIYFSDENNPDVQSQEYLLFTFRRPVEQIREIARQKGVDEETIKEISGDTDTEEQIGNTTEVDSEKGKALCILKLYKKKVKEKEFEKQIVTDEFGVEQEIEVEVGSKEVTKVFMCASTKNVVYIPEENLGLTLYPLAKLDWIPEKGSARGRGEPQTLINNQIEANKTLARRLLAVTMSAYPKLTYLEGKISNPSSLDKVGVAVGINGQNVQDVKSVIDYLRPVQVSPDAKQINDELTTNTKELSGAGDVALGNINPSTASGRSIIAVRDANTLPLNSNVARFRKFVEDIARIWFDMWQNTATEGKKIVIEQVDEKGQLTTTIETIPYELLQRLKVNIRVDVSNANPYNKFAQEQTIENLFSKGIITFEEYIELLDDDSVSPKGKLTELLRTRKEKEKQFNEIETQIQEQQMQAQQLVKNQTEGGENLEMPQLQIDGNASYV